MASMRLPEADMTLDTLLLCAKQHDVSLGREAAATIDQKLGGECVCGAKKREAEESGGVSPPVQIGW
eukprot:4422863-Prorocentrum_lima.AAC.1